MTRTCRTASKTTGRLAAYTQVMAEVAAERGIPFVNLFAFTESLYETSAVPMTINGIHLTPEGNRAVAHYIVQHLTGESPSADDATLEWVREAVVDKNWHGTIATAPPAETTFGAAAAICTTTT